MRIVYIITTLVIALLVGLAGGIVDIIQPSNVTQMATHLGYPLYFFFLLGVFKILGAVALLLPKRLDRFREIAYIGFTFDFIFASYSHFSVGDGFIKVITPLLFLTVLVVSYVLKSKYSLYKKSEV